MDSDMFFLLYHPAVFDVKDKILNWDGDSNAWYSSGNKSVGN